MLDDESTDTPTPADAGQEPPKKAPRKRATRAAAAPAPGEPAAAEGGGEEAKPPAKKAARKAPAKKAAAKKSAGKQVAEVATEPAEEALGRAEQDEAEAEQAQDAVPAEAAEALTEAVEAEEAEGPSGEQPAEPASRRRARAPMVVTFQAPPSTQEPAARTRRRAGTSGALSPDELLPQAEEAPGEDADEIEEDLAGTAARRRRRGRRGRGGAGRALAGEDTVDEIEDAGDDEAAEDGADEDGDGTPGSGTGTRRRRRRRRSGSGGADEAGDGADDGADDGDGVPTVVHVREPRQRKRRDGGGEADEDGVRGITGSTRMAAKRVRRQEGRDSGRKRAPILTEAEFLARRESVDRQMVVRQKGDRTQIAVLEDGILVEHYVAKASATSYAGNVYLGKVQNVLPSMEAAFVDIGKGRNAVLYAGEVNWEGVAGGQRKIEQALKSGQEVLVQVTKDPIGHKGARLTSQISLPGRYLVYVPEGSMTGISRKLPENERTRLKNILRNVVPEGAGVIIRTAAEGASEEEIAKDVRRLQAQWEVIKEKAAKGGAPKVLHAEPDLVIKVVRDIFNEDFNGLVVQGDRDWETIREYVEFVAPDLAPRMKRYVGEGPSKGDVFAEHRVDEQLLKALDRKVYLPSGGSLVIDRTEAMVVIDVNTGKYVGKGGNLEETVTRNNLEAAEEIARQLRLRDLGGIIVVDFIDMVLESNRDLVVRRLVECLGRDRTKHQVAEVTSLGLVQMTRKRVGQGLLESFSETCEHCNGRGLKVHLDPVEPKPERDRDRAPKVGAKAPVPAGSAPEAGNGAVEGEGGSGRSRRRRGGRAQGAGESGGDVEEAPGVTDPVSPAAEPAVPSQPEAAPEVAEQPATAEEDVPVLAEPASGGAEEPAAAAVVPQEAVKKRRRAAGRPAGAPTV